VSRLSRQCGILNISQPYRTQWPVTGIAFTSFYRSYLQITLLGYEMPCSLVEIYRRFGRTCHLYLQGSFMIDPNLVLPWSWKLLCKPVPVSTSVDVVTHHKTNIPQPPLWQLLISMVLACHENCMNEFMGLFLSTYLLLWTILAPHAAFYVNWTVAKQRNSCRHRSPMQ
jgi:hypothetical protein